MLVVCLKMSSKMYPSLWSDIFDRLKGKQLPNVILREEIQFYKKSLFQTMHMSKHALHESNKMCDG